jgi:hypothetical protein
VEHGRAAHAAMPGSQLELLDAGHFPQLEHPYEFARKLSEFVAATEPAQIAPETLRERVLAGAPATG